MSEELKPCPFCGGSKVQIIDYEFTDQIECDECGNLVRPSCWNTRPIEDALRAEIGKIKAILVDPEAVHQNVLMGSIVLPDYYIRTTDTHGEFAALHAENARLREALQRIADSLKKYDDDLPAYEIAYAALKGDA
ncbi:MAG: hypothetical protein ACYC36_06030 [Bellilinea sp.]